MIYINWAMGFILVLIFCFFPSSIAFFKKLACLAALGLCCCTESSLAEFSLNFSQVTNGQYSRASLVTQLVRNLLAMRETWV